VTVDLGTHFHARRLTIVASQVGTIGRARRATHDHAARTREVLALLAAPELDALLEPPVAFAAMPAAMASLYAGAALGFVPTIAYANRSPGAPAPS
jgi:hypothetical protein